MDKKSAEELKKSYLALLEELGAKRKKIEKKLRVGSEKIHKYRIFITTRNYLTLPIVVEAQDQGTAQLLARAQFPDARSIGAPVKIK